MRYKFFISFMLGDKFNNCVMNCKTKTITEQIIIEWTNLINQMSKRDDCVIVFFQRIK